MINIQKIGKLVLLAFIVTGFWACNDNDPEPFNFGGEVVTFKRTIDGEEKFALSYYAYANMKMDSASVDFPGDSTLTLSPADAQKLTYSYDASTEDFSTTAPATENYDFLVFNNGVEYTATENHIFTDVDIPTIDSVGVTTSSESVYVEWSNNDDAQGYAVQILNEDDEIVFNSYILADDEDSFTANQSTGSWETSLTTGETYTIEVQAMVFEDGATNANFFYQIETIAIASEEFIFED
ncbi:fibronectin type III domain-containing protein [Draconibacterium mangrovi]|uniref:fibronectin type III domain-containing protein n=1 Tax=Draconibacterium mangrovi TaxID=2697469 RepID=UPI0013D6A9FD|nr:fibronectin type III domain-containing protein [Draconibacterium mangrovi]